MSTEDNLIFKHYIKVAEVVAKSFEPFLETVVHDLRHPERSIIAIFNSHVTGRKIGDSATDLTYRRLKGEVPDVLINYKNESLRGEKIKSTTLAIRNSKGQLIGVFGMHFDISFFDKFHRFLEHFISTEKNPYIGERENFRFMSPSEEIRSAIEAILIHKGWANHSLSNKHKRDVIVDLYKQGHFNKRGAVTIVSDAMGITRASIYRYIKEGV